MSNYDFKVLSPVDFEDLCRDLLQIKLNCHLESFKIGRDKGIDLKYSTDDLNTLVIQCKHYSRSTFSNLKSNLKNKELPKVKKLNPQRYMVATSLGLTDSDKDEIIEIFKPYIKNSADIFGNQDLNNLLRNNPEIEKQNFKLWLSSSSVLESILHSDIFNRSKIELNSIKQKIKFYVKNESFKDAMKILKADHYCIISGIPGIGKTTLAEMLLINYMNEGYEGVKISSDITEALKVFSKYL